jgi:hypothetical protein
MDLSQNYLKRAVGIMPTKDQFDDLVLLPEDPVGFVRDELWFSLSQPISAEEEAIDALFMESSPKVEQQDCVDEEIYRSLVNDHKSPLFDSLCAAETSLDNLDCGSVKDSTYRTTYTAVRKYNQFWAEHVLDVTSEPFFYKLKSKYTSYVSSLCNDSF